VHCMFSLRASYVEVGTTMHTSPGKVPETGGRRQWRQPLFSDSFGVWNADPCVRLLGGSRARDILLQVSILRRACEDVKLVQLGRG